MDTPTTGFGRRSEGFTIIEVMLVVVVIGILAMIALRANLEFTARAQAVELLLAASGCRTVVSETYVLAPSPPAANTWGCEKALPTTRHVQSVSVDANGKISIVARNFNNPNIDGETMTMAPLIDGTPAVAASDWGRRINFWRCGSSEDGTTIPSQYLPSTCR